jgi:hypothetical protein
MTRKNVLDYLRTPPSEDNKDTTNSRCSDAITADITYDDHVVAKDHLAPSETTDKTTNAGGNATTENRNGLVPVASGEFIVNAAVSSTNLPTTNDFLLVDHDAVPGPPLLHRWTGYSTPLSSYHTAPGPAVLSTRAHRSSTSSRVLLRLLPLSWSLFSYPRQPRFRCSL